MPQKLKSSHKHMIVLNVGASKNETKGSEELLTQAFVGILLLQTKFNKR